MTATSYKSGPVLILASASPRRRKLLEKAGCSFDVIVSGIDESAFCADGITPARYAEKLALAKAMDVAQEHPGRVVIGADTVVDLDGQIIGKPCDEQHAEQITEMLFSGPHEVITGLAVVWLNKKIEIVESVSTIVYPREMTAEQIAEHIEGQTWRGKAGAYAIQETGDKFVERVEGSFTNVVGLPMERLNEILGEVLRK